MEEQLDDLFNSWTMSPEQFDAAVKVRRSFHETLRLVESVTPQHNARYLAMVKTHLEQACFLAVKGIAKPLQT